MEKRTKWSQVNISMGAFCRSVMEKSRVGRHHHGCKVPSPGSQPREVKACPTGQKIDKWLSLRPEPGSLDPMKKDHAILLSDGSSRRHPTIVSHTLLVGQASHTLIMPFTHFLPVWGEPSGCVLFPATLHHQRKVTIRYSGIS